MRSLCGVFLLAWATGCGQATTNTNVNDSGTSDGGTNDSGTPAAGVTGDDYATCMGAAAPTCPASQSATCGVCVPRPRTTTGTPTLERTRCDDTIRREYCRSGDPGTPNLSCFEAGHRPTAGTSQRVTMWGNVRVFGNGGNSDQIRITVYRPMADGTPGEMIGQTIAVITAPGNGMEDVYSPSRDRVLFSRNLGGYQIANVPTETELLVVTEGNPGDTTAAALWSHRIYDYNIMLRNDEVDVAMAPAGINGDHKVRFQPRVISNSDWSAIPSAATLVTGIPVGHGALAGEVHDCDDIRLANATVSSNPRPLFEGGTVYFSDNDTNPLPDTSRSLRGTSLLGTYALLDMAPGIVTAAAVGYNASQQLLHLGSYRARVFPDAVTIVTLRGLRPWQSSP